MTQRKVFVIGHTDRVLDPEVYRAMFDHYAQCGEPAYPHIRQLAEYCAPENITTFIAPEFPTFKELKSAMGHMKAPFKNRNKRGTK